MVLPSAVFVSRGYYRLSMGVVLGAIFLVGPVQAATISVHWCDSAGNNDTTAAQTWALGTGLALNTTYQTVTTVRGTIPTYRYIQNNSDVVVDFNRSGSPVNDPPVSPNWSMSSAAAINKYACKSSKDGGSSWQAADTGWTDYINNLAIGAVSVQLHWQVTTPTSITFGRGLVQTGTVTWVAAQDTGD